METFIKTKARQLGLNACGIAKAEPIEEEVKQYYLHWIAGRHHGEMSYLERNLEKRFDPTLLVPGCKSLIVCALNYFPSQPLDGSRYRIAYYAYGKDYHRVLKNKLHLLLHASEEKRQQDSLLSNELPASEQTFKSRVFVDSAPVLERYWAQKAGLGWIGRNRQLILPGAGSFFFLGILATDMELRPDAPCPNRCGKCQACVEACPTKALGDTFDARRCVSYLTIEQKSPIPSAFSASIEPRIYGCDSCQTVCPWNRFARPTDEESFTPCERLRQMSDADWENLTESQFAELFADSAVQRAGYDGLKRNIQEAKKRK